MAERDEKGRFIKGHKQLNTGKSHFKKGVKVRLGAKHSEESKAKMSKSKKGIMPSNLEYLRTYTRPRGKDNPLWKGSVDESKIWRRRYEYINWRLSVFERDNFECQRCEFRGKLHPHHMLAFAEHKEERFNVDNGITFCVECHKGFHKKYGKKNINPEQVKEYVKDYKETL